MRQFDTTQRHAGNVSGSDTVAALTSGKLTIATVSVDGAAIIGIVPCPGRNQVDGGGRRWRRELAADLMALEAWGAAALITFVEDHEFVWLGVPGFEVAVRDRGFIWYHLPITNMSPPGAAFEEAWRTNGADILGHLERGERIVVHCAGGLGRSGMIAAKLLTACGTPADEAMKIVREARPGAIETRDQEAYILDGPPLKA
jgi:ADP-ribosyl-[dinitrogen reductase] hydrolase